MTQVITVAPTERGWLVQRDMADPWRFERAAQAEWSARKLGEALAEGGQAAEIHVYLRDGALAGTFLCLPASSLEATSDRELQLA